MWDVYHLNLLFGKQLDWGRIATFEDISWPTDFERERLLCKKRLSLHHYHIRQALGIYAAHIIRLKWSFFFFFFARILPTDISHLLIPKAWAYFVNLTHKVLLLQYFRQEHFMCCLPIHLQYHCAQTCKRLFHPKEPNRMIHSLGPCISRRLEKAVTLFICHRSFLAVRRLNFFYTIRRMQQAKRLHGVWGKSQHHSPHSTLVQKQ